MHTQLLSCVQLFATLWTVAHQTLLFMEFYRQEYWSVWPFPSPGDPPNPRIQSCVSCIGRQIFYYQSTWEALSLGSLPEMLAACNSTSPP